MKLFDLPDKKNYSIGDNILVSASGGESSMFMLLETYRRYPKANILVVFANTGDEHEETLMFLKNIEDYYNIPINWIEAYVPEQKRIAPTPIVVNYEIADRTGKPLLDQSLKYGHCAISAPHCTRDLKVGIIHKLAKSVFKAEPYTTFQGIRADEESRINWKNAKSKNWDYPLARWGIKKADILNYWANHKKKVGFRLNLKEHQGNCNLCFKKSDRKLIQLIRETPCLIIFRITLELVSNTDKHDQYRGNMNAIDLLELAKTNITDDKFSDWGGQCFCS